MDEHIATVTRIGPNYGAPIAYTADPKTCKHLVEQVGNEIEEQFGDKDDYYSDILCADCGTLLYWEHSLTGHRVRDINDPMSFLSLF
jgi:hypothetical protein